MKFVMISKVIIEVDEDMELKSPEEFLNAVSNGKAKLIPQELEFQDENGNDMLNDDEYREVGNIIKMFGNGEA